MPIWIQDILMSTADLIQAGGVVMGPLILFKFAYVAFNH